MKNSATCERKENPKLYLVERNLTARDQKVAKDLMESFEGTSIFSDLSKEELDIIEGMLY